MTKTKWISLILVLALAVSVFAPAWGDIEDAVPAENGPEEVISSDPEEALPAPEVPAAEVEEAPAEDPEPAGDEKPVEDGKPVEDEKIQQIIDAAISAPTAKNVQPVKIWVIKSDDALGKIKSCTPFKWMENIPVVFAVGGTKDGAFVRPSDGRNFQDVDACIVATHMMLEIQALGLGTTWVGFFDEPKVKELFPDMKDYDLIALFPVGYPADDAAPADRHCIRKSLNEMVKFL